MGSYLVLGARAPAALEICRGLARGGHRVITADSMAFPLARFSAATSAYRRLPPATCGAGYGRALADLVTDLGIDWIVPTCEEVFHVARWRHMIPAGCNVLADGLDKLGAFHDKFAFTHAARDCGIGIPATACLRTCADLAAHAPESYPGGVVYKRCFSRFAEGTIVRPRPDQLRGMAISPDEPWVAQEFVGGVEVCSYSVAVSGKIVAGACYRPAYRAGRGAGIYFEPVRDDRLEDFVEQFVRKHSFTGQIGFDFIVDPERGPFVIECNPRATSGVHLLPASLDWGGLLDGLADADPWRMEGAAMVGMAMSIYGAGDLLRRPRTWLRDFVAARDVIWSRGDRIPALGQAVTAAETLLRAAAAGLSPLAATTADIKWDGEPGA